MLQDGSQLASDGFVLRVQSGAFNIGFATLCPIIGRYVAVLHPEGSCVRLMVAMTQSLGRLETVLCYSSYSENKKCHGLRFVSFLVFQVIIFAHGFLMELSNLLCSVVFLETF